MNKRIEFIESYIKQDGDADYVWNDNHGVLVRCKDCVHCADDWNGNQPMFTCELGRCGESVQPNDYCSLGERKEDE